MKIETVKTATTSILPSLFVSHGAPSFALEPGLAGDALMAIVQRIPKPKAILVVSAHWETDVPTISVASRPETIHDFYGFPQALYGMRYPAPGAVPLAMDVRVLLEEAGFTVALACSRGFDHGAWVPLRVLFPAADIPVLSMSVQSLLGPRHHYRLGHALASLREAGVLVIGSGSLTHNLGHFALLRDANNAPAYVTEFQEWIYQQLQAGNIEALLDYRHLAPGAVEAHPTEEHFLPFFVALGAAGDEPVAERLYGGIEFNMLAMDSYAFGINKENRA